MKIPKEVAVLRASLVNAVAEAGATEEGFYVTEDQAKQRKIKWPTIAQLNNNPGNLAVWGSHPIRYGFVHFLPDIVKPGQPLPKDHTGWKALRRQYERMIFERHLTFFTMYAGQRDVHGNVIKGGYSGYASKQASPLNDPERYASHVLAWLKSNWEPLSSKPQPYKDTVTINTVVETLV